MATEEPAEKVEHILDKPPPGARPPKKKRLIKAKRRVHKEKAKQEFDKLEIRDLSRRELELSEEPNQKDQESWENMCMENKLIEMKDELVEWERKFNRVVEQKDEKVKLILNEMATTEEMHKRNYSTQLQIMNYLTDTLSAFEDSAKLLYEAQVSEMLHDFYQEVDHKTETENQVKLNCENVVHATNLIVEQEMLTDYRIFLDKRDDRVNTEIEKRYCLRDSITNKMKHLHKQLLAFLDSLRNTSLDVHKYERVNALMARQRNFLIESQKLDVIELRSSSLYADLQRDLVLVEADDERKINDLKLEQAYFVQMRKSIENEMKLDGEQTHEKLKILTTETFKVLKKYQKLQKYGELLLSLAANCRKLQTESEKVVPWHDVMEPRHIEIHDDQFKLQVLDLQAHVDLTEEQLQAEMQLMKNFWRRQAVAEAQIVLLEEEKRHLTTENQHYINIIKRMSKADDVDDLKEALNIQCVLKEATPCSVLHNNYSYK